jgi:hypothetical protein
MHLAVLTPVALAAPAPCQVLLGGERKSALLTTLAVCAAGMNYI